MTRANQIAQAIALVPLECVGTPRDGIELGVELVGVEREEHAATLRRRRKAATKSA